jgi:transcriptional regulator of NAD metabolism
VLGVITELDRTHLELLATDLRATLNRIEQELETRRTRRDREH